MMVLEGSVGVIRGECIVYGLFFFFQAEDGIRDVAVTGVQTCALPISGNVAIKLSKWSTAQLIPRASCHVARRFARGPRSYRRQEGLRSRPVRGLYGEIGRASCRERV